MPTFISMLRGINVSGHNPLKMAELTKLYGALGFERVRTYLQSGNVLFDAAESSAPKCAEAVHQRIHRDFGYDVSVTIKTPQEISRAVSVNPFAQRAGIDQKFLHATFLLSPPPSGKSDHLKFPLGEGEEAKLVGDVVFLHCPNGYGRTKVTNGYFEKAFGVAATTRNWNTVLALEKLGRE